MESDGLLSPEGRRGSLVLHTSRSQWKIPFPPYKWSCSFTISVCVFVCMRCGDWGYESLVWAVHVSAWIGVRKEKSCKCVFPESRQRSCVCFAQGKGEATCAWMCWAVVQSWWLSHRTTVAESVVEGDKRVQRVAVEILTTSLPRQ